jgi:hypothetical protein
MPELGTYGSVRGAAGNSRPYRECRPFLDGATRTGAVVGKPPGKEPARRGVLVGARYGDLIAAKRLG